MPLLPFMDRFVPAVENGIAELEGRPLPHPGVRPKRQTIRKPRADGRDPKAGQTLYLYEKARTPEMRKLGEATCTKAMAVRIGRNRGGRPVVSLGDAYANRRLASVVAKADGFESPEDLVDFVEKVHGLPFRGYVLRW